MNTFLEIKLPQTSIHTYVHINKKFLRLLLLFLIKYMKRNLNECERNKMNKKTEIFVE